jgi:hypothetical protein
MKGLEPSTFCMARGSWLPPKPHYLPANPAILALCCDRVDPRKSEPFREGFRAHSVLGAQQVLTGSPRRIPVENRDEQRECRSVGMRMLASWWRLLLRLLSTSCASRSRSALRRTAWPQMFSGWPTRDVRSTLEGLTIGSRARREDLSCRWPTSKEALYAVFGAAGCEPMASDPGFVASELIRQVGGLPMARLLQYPEVLKMLDRAAHQATELTDEQDRADRRRPRGRMIPRGEVERVLRALPDLITPRNWTRHLDQLVDRGLLQVGIRIDCTHCRFAGWYGLEAIATELRCERCLRTFPFPQAEPPQRDRWAYRPAGAAAVEHFAAGSYAVMFALGFLAGDYSFEPVSWCTATHLSRELEVDFAALHRGDDEHRQAGQTLLLGEAKSFSRFEARDMSRLHSMRRRFPGQHSLQPRCAARSIRMNVRRSLRCPSRPSAARPTCRVADG